MRLLGLFGGIKKGPDFVSDSPSLTFFTIPSLSSLFIHFLSMQICLAHSCFHKQNHHPSFSNVFLYYPHVPNIHTCSASPLPLTAKCPDRVLPQLKILLLYPPPSISQSHCEFSSVFDTETHFFLTTLPCASSYFLRELQCNLI